MPKQPMPKQPMPKSITRSEKYRPAMEITDQKEADDYFELCVENCMQFGKSREEAEQIERSNLGYFAGYHSEETQRRVQKLFHCQHPIFGSIEENGLPTPQEAFEAGYNRGSLDKRNLNENGNNHYDPTATITFYTPYGK